MKEQEIQTKIIKYLTSIGAYTEKVIAGTRSGLPDIRGCYKSIFFAIEVKTPATRHNTSKLQEVNLRKIKDAGGYAITAWELAQAKEMIKEIDNDSKKYNRNS